MEKLLTNGVKIGKMVNVCCIMRRKHNGVKIMKKLSVLLLFLCVLVASSFAGYSDGFITAGEYEYGIIWDNNNRPLIVDGGGADTIDMQNYSRLEVRSTSVPVNGNWYVGGILDIHLLGNSHLDFLGGYTDLISLNSYSTADIKGGYIDSIRSLQAANSFPHINLYCQPGWSWIGAENNYTGVTGLWENGNNFSIDFIDDDWGYCPATWTNINVIPEPMSLMFLAAGSLMIRKH